MNELERGDAWLDERWVWKAADFEDLQGRDPGQGDEPGWENSPVSLLGRAARNGVEIKVREWCEAAVEIRSSGSSVATF